MTASSNETPESTKETSHNRRMVVTGATGFVGSHVVARLLEAGAQVTCLVRPSSDLRWIAGLDVRIQRLDMEDGNALRSALSNQQVVVHMAGAVKAEHAAQFFHVNLDLTKRMLDAALDADDGPRRFVFLSSLAAAGPTGPRAEREGLVHRPVSAYGRSKRAAESVLLAAGDDIDLVILRPTAVYGPRDRAMLPAFKAAALGLALAPAGRRQRVSFCHVQDLATALVAAATKPVPSGRILPIASTGDITMAEFNETLLSAMQNALGRSRPGVSLALSPMVLRMAGRLAGTVARIFGRATILDRDKAMELTAGDWIVDKEPARDTLDFVPRWSLREGLEQTAAWYRQEGWL